jgi:hypothetical protein
MTRTYYAIYREPEQLLGGIAQLQQRGFEQLEVYTPYPVEGLAEALAQPRSSIPARTFYVGLAGAALTYAIQWLLNAYLYPINVGARPPHFPLSYVPICFEVGILCAALTAFASVMSLGRLGRLWDPVFELPEFQSATRDRHWLGVPAGERGEELARALADSGAERVITSEDAPCD